MIVSSEESESGWRISAKLVIPAPWNPEWKAGSWISNRMGQHAKAVSHRARMTATQKQRLDALPYGQSLIAGTHPASCM